MLMTFNWAVVTSDLRPVWTGTKWLYQGRTFLSLRHMKRRSAWKLEDQAIRRNCAEIAASVDADILNYLLQFNKENKDARTK